MLVFGRIFLFALLMTFSLGTWAQVPGQTRNNDQYTPTGSGPNRPKPVPLPGRDGDKNQGDDRPLKSQKPKKPTPNPDQSTPKKPSPDKPRPPRPPRGPFGALTQEVEAQVASNVNAEVFLSQSEITFAEASATVYDCRGVKDTKGRFAVVHISGNNLVFIDTSNNNHQVKGKVNAPSNGWCSVSLDSPYFNALSVSVSMIKTGSGFVSGYVMDGGHPGDFTKFLYHCSAH